MGTPSTQDMNALLATSVARIKDGDFEAAETLLSDVLTIETRHPVALYLMGLTQFERARWARAEEFFRRALAASPGRPEICLHLAQCLRALQRPAEALAFCRMVLKAQPGHGGAWLELAKAQEESGAAADAEATYRQMLARSPDAEIVLNYSRFLNTMGRAPEAEVMLRHALAKEFPGHG